MEIRVLKSPNDKTLWKKEYHEVLGSSGMHHFTVRLLKLIPVSLFTSLQHVFWNLWQFSSLLRTIFCLHDAPGSFYHCCRRTACVFRAWLLRRGFYNRLRAQTAIIPFWQCSVGSSFTDQRNTLEVKGSSEHRKPKHWLRQPNSPLCKLNLVFTHCSHWIPV